MASPKYSRVQSGIVNMIAAENIQVGEKLPTEKQLSEHFGVGIITIRRAVKHLEEANIVQRKQGRGTFVLTKIQGKVNNGTIVFLEIMREELRLVQNVYSIKELDSELGRRGYNLNYLLVGQNPDTDAVKRLKDVRGVIATGWINSEWVQILKGFDIPVVFLGGTTCDPLDIPMVFCDYRKMAAILARHLYGKGAKKIGLILGGHDYAPSTLMREGLVSVMKERGERLEPSMIYYSDDIRPLASSYNIKDFLANNPELDGLLIEAGCYVHVLNCLIGASRIPLMGVMTEEPRFGSVCLKSYEASFKGEIHEKAIEMLLGLIHSGRKTTGNVMLEPYLVSSSKESDKIQSNILT